MRNTPRITVVMATFNRSNVLPYSIGSVLAQTRSDFELLVVGDGCTDDSQAVVEGIGDPRVRWIGLAENSGHQSVPNNAGLAHARGDYIAYLGHDDLWLPHHLDVCVGALDNGCDLAFGLTLIVGGEATGNFLGPATLPYEPGEWISPSSVVHRKSATDAVGHWQHYTRVRSVPEADLWCRIQQAGYRLSLMPRLSVVKIPAATRKDVYKHRSTREQAFWQARMRDEADFEASVLAECYINLRSLDPGQFGTVRYKKVVKHFVLETLFRIRRRLRKPFWRRTPMIEQFRQHKGLNPKP